MGCKLWKEGDLPFALQILTRQPGTDEIKLRSECFKKTVGSQSQKPGSNVIKVGSVEGWTRPDWPIKLS